MGMFYRLAADAVVAIHLAFMLFVVVGELLILCGILRKWQWVRNFTFRSLHFVAIAVVVAESLCGVTCPLTVWEQNLRRLAGNESYTGDFIPNLMHDLLFIEAAPWVFTLLYAAFGIVVLLTLVFAPPRRPRWLAPRAVTDSR